MVCQHLQHDSVVHLRQGSRPCPYWEIWCWHHFQDHHQGSWEAAGQRVGRSLDAPALLHPVSCLIGSWYSQVGKHCHGCPVWMPLLCFILSAVLLGVEIHKVVSTAMAALLKISANTCIVLQFVSSPAAQALGNPCNCCTLCGDTQTLTNCCSCCTLWFLSGPQTSNNPLNCCLL